MRGVRHVATLVTLAFSTSAAAQLQSAEDRLAGRLDASTREQVVALVDSLKSEGLPIEPIVDRALEGASKRAEGSRIVSVVRGFATHLRVARSVLGPGSNEREVIAGANALKAGIKKEELTRIRAARDGVRYAVAFDVLTGLKNRNVPNDTAVRVIGALVKLAANDHQYVALLDQIERAIAAGTPPALAASEQGITVERAVVAEGNSGTPGGQLPSPRGVLQTGPSVTGPTQGTATQVRPDGQGAPAPRGKSQKPRKP